MRRLVRTLLVVVVLLGILALADQIARTVAERQLAQQVQTSQSLPSRPAVSLAGWPFVTQAIAGHYAGGTVTAHDLTVRSLRIDRLDVHLTDVHEPLSDLLHRDIRQATADTVTATAHLTYADLARASGVPGLALSGSAGRIRVQRTVTVLGASADLSATARLVVRGGSLRAEDVRATAGTLGIPGSFADAAFEQVLSSVRPGALPYGLRLSGVRVTSTGVDLAAQAENVSVTR